MYCSLFRYKFCSVIKSFIFRYIFCSVIKSFKSGPPTTFNPFLKDQIKIRFLLWFSVFPHDIYAFCGCFRLFFRVSGLDVRVSVVVCAAIFGLVFWAAFRFMGCFPALPGCFQGFQTAFQGVQTAFQGFVVVFRLFFKVFVVVAGLIF
jgi:hypothetical protein